MTKFARATRFLGLALSALIIISVWGLFIHEYLNASPVPPWLLVIAILLTLLSLLTIFGKERLRSAFDFLDEF